MAAEPSPAGPSGALAAFTLLFGAAACLSLGLMAPHLPSLLEMDSLGYYKSAINLMRHGVFSEAGAPGLHPISFRTPGYPFLLAGLFRLTGPGVLAPAVLNLALLWATGMMAMRAAGMLGAGSRTSLAAGLLVSANPLALFWATQVYTDTLFVAVLVAGLMLGLPSVVGRPCARRLAAASAVAGLLPLVRPLGLYVVVAAVGAGLLLLGLSWPGLGRSRRLRAALLALVCTGLALAPTLGWMARNKSQFGTFHFCEIGAWNLRFAHMNVVLSEAEGADFGRLFADSFKETYPRIYRPTTSPGVLAEGWTREALDIATRHPGTALRVAARNLRPLLSPSVADWRRGLGREGEPSGAWRLAAGAEWLLVLGVAAWSIWNLGVRFRAREQRAPTACLALLAALLVLLSLPAGNMTAARFRLPVWPVLVLLACVGRSPRGCGRGDQGAAAASCSAT